MPGLFRNFVLATCTFVVMGHALAANEVPNSVTFESITPAELALVVSGWQEKYDNSDIIIKGAKGKTYQSDLTKLLDQLQSLENWDSLNKDERVKLGNSYENLRAQTDGGEASANQRRCTMERRAGSNLRKMVCITAAEQARADKLNQSVLSDIERNGRRQHVGSDQ
jgi:hypothetical protein